MRFRLIKLPTMKNILFRLFLFLTTISSINAQSWSKIYFGGTGSPEIITSFVGIDGDLYFAGNFTDTFYHPMIYKWDGHSFLPAFLPIPTVTDFHTQRISTMCQDVSGNIYAAGSFENAAGYKYVARWDGASWTELGAGAGALNANNTIVSICVDAVGNVYAAGSFTNSDTEAYVARWDGTTWSELGTGATALHANRYINTICLDPSGNLYAAGGFSDSSVFHLGDVYVAKWDGTSWTELGDGISYYAGIMEIYSLVADASGAIYAGGRLDYNTIYKWDGISWEPLGGSMDPLTLNGTVYTMCIDPDGNLYAGGDFTDSALFVTSNCYVGMWNGTDWSQLGDGAGRLFPHSYIYNVCAAVTGEVWAMGEFVNTDDSGFIAKYSSHSLSVSFPNKSTPSIEVYPSPVMTTLDIETSAGSTYIGAKYIVTDMQGKVVSTGMIADQKMMLDVSNFADGMYVFTVQGEQPISIKVIKHSR